MSNPSTYECIEMLAKEEVSPELVLAIKFALYANGIGQDLEQAQKEIAALKKREEEILNSAEKAQRAMKTSMGNPQDRQMALMPFVTVAPKDWHLV